MKSGKLTRKQLKQINYDLRVELVSSLEKIGTLKKRIAELEKRIKKYNFNSLLDKDLEKSWEILKKNLAIAERICILAYRVKG